MEKWLPGTLGTLLARVIGLGCGKLTRLALASGAPAFAICVREPRLSEYFSLHVLFLLESQIPNLVNDHSTFSLL